MASCQRIEDLRSIVRIPLLRGRLSRVYLGNGLMSLRELVRSWRKLIQL